jgi:anti-sigma B factor antagonist
VIPEEPLDADSHVIAVCGDRDRHTTPELSQKLIDAIEGGKTRLVVNLSGATWVSETGVFMLEDAASAL